MRRRLQERQKTRGYDLYLNDPVGFIEDILGERVWERQREIAVALCEENVAVPSCFGSGKSWISARIVAWWVATGGVAITTASTFRQVRDILWRELREAHFKGGLPGSIPQVECRWETGSGAWAIGIKPEDSNREAFQGIHGSRVLTVYDEANGVSSELWEAGRGLAVGADDRRLAIGNPHEPSGPFFEACRSKTWRVIPISVFDTPNFTGEAVSSDVSSKLVDASFIEQAKADGLEGTPWWSAKVLGQFPDTASDGVIPLALVEQARIAEAATDGHEWAGLDVARFGSDDTVLVEGAGHTVERVTIVHGQDTMAVAGMGAEYLKNRRGVLAIDEGGVGGGVYDRIKEQRLPGTVLAVNAGSSPDNDPADRLVNMRSQLWWHAREALYRGEVSLARLPDDQYQRLRSELTAPRYRFSSSGKVVIESKEEMVKRGVPSPDLADAFNLGIYARARTRKRAASFGAAA